MRRTGYQVLCGALLAAAVFSAAETRAQTNNTGTFVAPSIDANTEGETTKRIDSGQLSGDALAQAYFTRCLARGNFAKPEAAVDDCTRAIKIEDKPEFHALRAALYANTRQYDEALADGAAMVRLAPNSAAGHIVRGRIFALMNRKDDYRSEFDRAIALTPNPYNLLGERGEFYFEDGDSAAAIADDSAALKIAPGSPDMLSNRGNAKMQVGDYAGALADYDSALALDATSTLAPSALENRAIALYALGRSIEAAVAAQRAADASPYDAYRLLWLDYTVHRAEHANAAGFERRASVMDELRWPWPIVALNLGRMNEQAVWAAAAKGAPDVQRLQSCEVAFHLAEFKLFGGDPAAAHTLFQRARDICPPWYTESIGAKIELDNLSQGK